MGYSPHGCKSQTGPSYETIIVQCGHLCRCPEGRGPYLVVVVAGQQDEQRQRQGDVRSLGDVLLGQLPL